MQVALDTNIILSSPKMDNDLFKALYHYLELTNSTLKMSTIVQDETKEGYKRELKKRIKILQKEKNDLDTYIISSLPPISISLEDEVNLIMDNIASKFSQFSDDYVYDYSFDMCKEGVRRAIERIKPCSEGKEEIRDTLIWLSTIEQAKKSGENAIIFISKNTKEFSDGKGNLHPDLKRDAEQNNIVVHYYDSLFKFIKEHATNIEEFTDSKIDEVETTSNIEEDIYNFLYGNCLTTIERYMSRRHYTDIFDVELGRLLLHRQDFFVLEQSDSSYVVIANYLVNIETIGYEYDTSNYDEDEHIKLQRKVVYGEEEAEFTVSYKFDSNISYLSHEITDGDVI